MNASIATLERFLLLQDRNRGIAHKSDIKTKKNTGALGSADCKRCKNAKKRSEDQVVENEHDKEKGARVVVFSHVSRCSLTASNAKQSRMNATHHARINVQNSES